MRLLLGKLVVSVLSGEREYVMESSRAIKISDDLHGIVTFFGDIGVAWGQGIDATIPLGHLGKKGQTAACLC